MKYFAFLFFFTSVISYAFPQEIKTTYHDKKESLSNIDDSYFYRFFSLDTILNNINIYKVEEYYSKDDTPKKIAFLTEIKKNSYKYFHEKREYFENGNLQSLLKYNIKGEVIDTAYYCYPNGNLKLITYNPRKQNDSVSNNTILYLGFYDENQTALLLNGNGYLKLPLLSNLNTNNYEEGFMRGNIKHGIWRGIINGYFFEEEYQDGNLIQGFSMNPEGIKKEYNNTNIKTDPDYPGGEIALKAHIGTNYKYPHIAIENGIKGTIIAEIIIEENGNVSDVKIIQDLGFDTGIAAVDILMNLNHLIPGTIKGIPIKSSWIIPIKLDLVEF